MTQALSSSAKELVKRHRVFVDAYLSNGRNATRAAIVAGYSPRTAGVAACKLMNRPAVKEILARREEKLPQITGLSAERTLLEIARLAFFDPRKMYNEDGSLKRIVDMDEDTRAAIASVDTDALGTKLKMHSKTEALNQAAKNLGLYEKNNQQQAPNLNLQIVLVRKDGRSDLI